MNIKKANVAELAMTNGVSLVLARRIHTYVKEHPSANMDDLLLIKGIGPRKLMVLKDHFY